MNRQFPRLLAFAAALAFLSPVSGQPPAVALQVRPLFLLQRGDVRVEVRVPRHAANRRLAIAWISDVGTVGSTQRVLDADDAAVLHTLDLPGTPPANYFFTATVFGSDGKPRGRADARIRNAADDGGALPVVLEQHLESTDYVTSVIVRRAESFDFAGRLYFQLTHGNATQGSGQWIDVSAEPDSALATFLERHVGKRVSVTLRAGSPLTRDGEDP